MLDNQDDKSRLHPDPATTHWVDCWREHAQCARVAAQRLESIRAENERLCEVARALVTVLRWHIRHDPADEYMDEMPQLLALETVLAENRDDSAVRKR